MAGWFKFLFCYFLFPSFPRGGVLSLFPINNNPSPGRRTPHQTHFAPLPKNIHFLAGKSMFFVSNAFAHFCTLPWAVSKMCTFLKENQYFAFPCLQPTIFCFQKMNIFIQENQFFHCQCISAFFLSPLVPSKTFIFL